MRERIEVQQGGLTEIHAVFLYVGFNISCCIDVVDFVGMRLGMVK